MVKYVNVFLGTNEKKMNMNWLSGGGEDGLECDRGWCAGKLLKRRELEWVWTVISF